MNYFFVAGFDFGTSYSKVVVRDQLTNVAKVVTFDCAPSGILPSCLGVSKGKISGPDRDASSLLLPYPKLLAADTAAQGKQFQSLYQQKLSAVEAHLGTGDLHRIARLLLCRYCLTIIDGVHDFILADEDWSAFDPAADPLVIQAAVPSGLLSNSDRRFEDLVQGALAAATVFRSQHPKNNAAAITTADLDEAFQAVAEMTADERHALHYRCVVYPEVAAGVQTVLRSRSTPDGKYITLDIGAGTIDLNVFNRWRQGGGDGSKRSLDYWGCRVAPLGFARIDHKRPRQGAGEHETVVEPIPEAQLMKLLEAATKSLMQGAFRFQPFTSLGTGPSPWAKETYCYVWGGGANHAPYSDHFLSALKSVGLDVVHANRLPRPSDDFGLPDGLDFGRLAVAFGLSFHEANLEDVRLPSQLKTFAERHPDKWKLLIESPAVSSSRSTSWARVGASLESSYIPSVDPSSRARRTPARKVPKRPVHRRISPYEVTLEALLEEYLAKGERMLIANRVRRLNHIWDLCKRPEVNNNTELVEKAIAVVNQPLRNYRGRIKVLSGSAEFTDGSTLSVVVKLRGRQEHEEMEIRSGHHLQESINEPETPSRFLEVLCSIEEVKHSPVRFHLLPLRDRAEPPRVRSRPDSSAPRPKRDTIPWNNPFRNL